MFKILNKVKYFCLYKTTHFDKRLEFLNIINKNNSYNLEQFKNKNFNLKEILKSEINDNKILSIFMIVKNWSSIKNELNSLQFLKFCKDMELEIFRFKDKILFEEVLFLITNLGKHNFIDKKIMSDWEQLILEYKDNVISKNYEAPKLIIKILKNFILNDYAKSEFLYDVVEWVRLMTIENMVSLKEMCKIVNILSKSSSNMKNFFGYKNMINNHINQKYLKLGLDDIFVIYKYCHEIKILNNDIYNKLENRAWYLLKHNETIETYKLNLSIIKNNYNVDDKILYTLTNFINMFVALHNKYDKRTQIIDKIQGISLKYIDGLSNNLFIKIFISYFNNYYINKEIEDLLIKELKIRIKGLNLRELIFSMNKYSFSGIKEINLVKDYFTLLDSKFDEETNFHYLLKSLETLIQLQYYYYPEELITKDANMINTFVEIKELVLKNLNYSFSRINEFVDNFDKLQKTSDIMKIIKLMNGLNSLIIVNEFNDNIVEILDKCTKIIWNNSEVIDVYLKKMKIKQLENIEDSYSNNYNYFDINNISEIFIIYSEFNYKNIDFMNKIMVYLESNINLIHKDFFAGVYKNFNIYKYLKKRNEFIESIIELQKYGDYKYFFKHNNYIQLVSGIIFNFFRKYLNFIKNDSFDFLPSISKDINSLFFKNLEKTLKQLFFKDLDELTENLLMINNNNLNGNEVKLLNDLIIFLQNFTEYKQIDTLWEKIKNIDTLLNYEILYKVNLSLKNKIDYKEYLKKEIELQIKDLDYNNYFLDFNFTDDFLNILDVVLIMKLKNNKILKLGFIIINDDSFIDNDLKLNIGLNLFNLNHILKWNLLFIRDKEIENNKDRITEEIKKFINLNLEENKLIN